eukprot:3531253-Prymnesium_polylepis.1
MAVAVAAALGARLAASSLGARLAASSTSAVRGDIGGRLCVASCCVAPFVAAGRAGGASGVPATTLGAPRLASTAADSSVGTALIALAQAVAGRSNAHPGPCGNPCGNQSPSHSPSHSSNARGGAPAASACEPALWGSIRAPRSLRLLLRPTWCGPRTQSAALPPCMPGSMTGRARLRGEGAVAEVVSTTSAGIKGGSTASRCFTVSLCLAASAMRIGGRHVRGRTLRSTASRQEERRRTARTETSCAPTWPAGSKQPKAPPSRSSTLMHSLSDASPPPLGQVSTPSPAPSSDAAIGEVSTCASPPDPTTPPPGGFVPRRASTRRPCAALALSPGASSSSFGDGTRSIAPRVPPRRRRRASSRCDGDGGGGGAASSPRWRATSERERSRAPRRAARVLTPSQLDRPAVGQACAAAARLEVGLQSTQELRLPWKGQLILLKRPTAQDVAMREGRGTPAPTARRPRRAALVGPRPPRLAARAEPRAGRLGGQAGTLDVARIGARLALALQHVAAVPADEADVAALELVDRRHETRIPRRSRLRPAA